MILRSSKLKVQETPELKRNTHVNSEEDSKKSKKRKRLTVQHWRDENNCIQHPCTFHEINLTLKYKFTIPEAEHSCIISGCIVHPDGRMMFIDRDYNHRLSVHNEKGMLERDVNFSNQRPTDISSIDSKAICVSFCNDPRLELINTDTFETTQVIPTKQKCSGVTFYNRHLFWCEQNIGIQMKHLTKGRVITLVKFEDDRYWSSIKVHADRIYHTRESHHTVTCHSLSGKKIWEFKDETLIKNPYGITVDNNSNVYVASYSNNKIVVLSPDGRNCRQILGLTDGVNQPIALYFDQDSNVLIVTNLTGSVFVYNVS